MRFNKLSLSERIERTRVIYYSNIYTDSVTPKYLKHHLQEAKKRVYEQLSVPSTMTKLFQAAATIRKNYSEWNEFLRKPSRPPPKVFRSFSDDKMLVFYLFLGEYLNVFHLDPTKTFILGKWVSPSTILIHGKKDSIYADVKFVVYMWKSLGSPWKESRCGKDLAGLAKGLKRPNARTKQQEDFCVAWHFWEFSTQFGLYKSLSTQDYMETDTGRLIFDISFFVEDAATAVAFDHSGLNTLELIRELFSQIQGLVPNIIQTYALLHNNPYKKNKEDKFWKVILQGKSKCAIPAGSGKMAPLRKESFFNRSIVHIFNKYPEILKATCDNRIGEQFFFRNPDRLLKLEIKLLRIASPFYEGDYAPVKFIGREGNDRTYVRNNSHHQVKATIKEEECTDYRSKV